VTLPLFSVGEYTTRSLTFQEDLAVYRAAGVQGIGIDAGLKLNGEPEEHAAFDDSGLQATFCFGSTPSILPLPQLPGTDDPAQRVLEVCAGIDELAPYDPLAYICVTGPQGSYSEARARDLVVRGLREVAQAASARNITVAVEPMHTSLRGEWSLVTNVPDTIDLLDAVGEPNVGMIVDVWHLWDTPDLLAHLSRHADRVAGVQVNDWRESTRSWCDRVLPGDGLADLTGILEALRSGGYDGWYELEIFSDDGTFGNSFPDSLWKQAPEELVRAGREKFFDLWRSL
jgi:sugar phosphate isomerase/epimerase